MIVIMNGPSLRCLEVALAFALLTGSVRSQVTERVSLNSLGREAASGVVATTGRAISEDGRWVVFRSISANLVPGDTNAGWDIFARDRLLNNTVRVSISSAGEQSDGFSGAYGVWVCPSGRFVGFESVATNLAPG